MSTVTCRYGPSPSGNLHVGSARTALFIYLFAKSRGGKFILRIDDTDQVRSNYDYTAEAIESLQWLGIRWDEGPVYQSHRFDLYRKYIRQLLETGHAYEETTEKGTAVRFRMPKRVMSFDDLIHGPVSENMATYDDFVIQRSDGIPTYQVATVIDDHLLGVTVAPRGNDLMRSTHRQNAIYVALGWEPPRYAHIPLVTGPDGKKLSKRHGATSVLEYRANGYLPAALLNYLATLGWAPANRQELMTLPEMEKLFDYRRISRTSVVFNSQKLNWYNRQYLKTADRDGLTGLLAGQLGARHACGPSFDPKTLPGIVELLTPRYYSNTDEFVRNAGYFLTNDIGFEAGVLSAARPELVPALIEALTEAGWEPAALAAAVAGFTANRGVRRGEVLGTLRAALTGRKVTPDPVRILHLLGRDRALGRLRRFAAPLPPSSAAAGLS